MTLRTRPPDRSRVLLLCFHFPCDMPQREEQAPSAPRQPRVNRTKSRLCGSRYSRLRSGDLDIGCNTGVFQNNLNTSPVRMSLIRIQSIVLLLGELVRITNDRSSLSTGGPFYVLSKPGSGFLKACYMDNIDDLFKSGFIPTPNSFEESPALSQTTKLSLPFDNAIFHLP